MKKIKTIKERTGSIGFSALFFREKSCNQKLKADLT